MSLTTRERMRLNHYTLGKASSGMGMPYWISFYREVRQGNEAHKKKDRDDTSRQACLIIKERRQ